MAVLDLADYHSLKPCFSFVDFSVQLAWVAAAGRAQLRERAAQQPHADGGVPSTRILTRRYYATIAGCGRVRCTMDVFGVEL